MMPDENKFSNQELAEIASKIEEMAKSSLKEKAEELELILQSTSDGILVLNLDGMVIHAKNRFMDIWSLDRADSLIDLTNPLLTEQLIMQQSILQKSKSCITLPSGSIIEQNYCPVIDNNEIKGKLWMYRDVTEQVQSEEALRTMATTDALTGIWNRRHFMSQGQREFELLKRTELPLSVIFIDVDRFKLLNDTFGHSMGDEALKYLAQCVSNLIRSTDLFARLGGEEFCILAPNTSLEAGCILAEKLRLFFENNTLIFNGQSIPFTLSLGVSCCESGDLTFEKLIEYADSSCYEAKSLGRNRVVAHDSARSVKK